VVVPSLLPLSKPPFSKTGASLTVLQLKHPPSLAWPRGRYFGEKRFSLPYPSGAVRRAPGAVLSTVAI
jgi:hypothetical protein